jgi:hypothetical protein
VAQSAWAFVGANRTAAASARAARGKRVIRVWRFDAIIPIATLEV